MTKDLEKSLRKFADLQDLIAAADWAYSVAQDAFTSLKYGADDDRGPPTQEWKDICAEIGIPEQSGYDDLNI